MALCYPFGAFVCLIGWLLGSSAYGQTQQNEVLTARLQTLTNGLKFAEVEAVLGNRWRHQFTVASNDQTWLGVSYSFEKPFIYYYFIFRDAELVKICAPAPFAVEIVKREGMRVEVRKPVVALNRWQEVMKSEALNARQLAEDIHRRLPSQRNASGIVPAVAIVSPLLVPAIILEKPEVARAYQRNQELAGKFNPMKLKLGMQATEISTLFGLEKSRMVLHPTEEQLFWTDEVLSKVRPEHRYSPVSVILVKGRLTAVFSNDFVAGVK